MLINTNEIATNMLSVWNYVITSKQRRFNYLKPLDEDINTTLNIANKVAVNYINNHQKPWHKVTHFCGPPQCGAYATHTYAIFLNFTKNNKDIREQVNIAGGFVDLGHANGMHYWIDVDGKPFEPIPENRVDNPKYYPAFKMQKKERSISFDPWYMQFSLELWGWFE